MIVIYLDHAATTPLDPQVLEVMIPYLKDSFGNPSSLHRLGEEASNAVEHAREILAKAVGSSPEQVTFTSGGTEADNLGMQLAVGQRRPVCISSIEHPAVRDSAFALRNQGFLVREWPVISDGILDLARARTMVELQFLCAVMHVNNEIGTIQPLKEVAEIVHEKGGVLFVDCVQSFLKLPATLDLFGADAMAISAHKVNGPKGVGAFMVSDGLSVSKLMFGGDQEHDQRPGTPSVANIVGFGRAVELGWPIDEERMLHMEALRDRLIDGILDSIPGSWLNGSRMQRICNNVNVSFPGVEGRLLLDWLSKNGVCASLGSACSSARLEPSHVLNAIGLSAEQSLGSLRFTLGKSNTKDEIREVIVLIKEGVELLRKKSHK